MSEIRNTIECPQITNVRLDGNTTRQTNFAVELLFNGFKVRVMDHFANGLNYNSNNNLCSNIIDRLILEHKLDVDDIIIDRKKLMLELKKS